MRINLFLYKILITYILSGGKKYQKYFSGPMHAGVQVLILWIFPGIFSLTFVFAQQVTSGQMLQAELNWRSEVQGGHKVKSAGTG